MKLVSVILMSILTSTALAQTPRMILNCDTADLTARPYTHFQIVTGTGSTAEMKYMTFPFYGAEIFPLVQQDDGLLLENSDRGSATAETKTIGGGFSFSWGDGDAAHMSITRTKLTKKVNGKYQVIKGKVLTGSIQFPNGNGPQHLHDGGVAQVTCTPVKSAWGK